MYDHEKFVAESAREWSQKVMYGEKAIFATDSGCKEDEWSLHVCSPRHAEGFSGEMVTLQQAKEAIGDGVIKDSLHSEIIMLMDCHGY